MNPDTEYELFTQEIYQTLVNAQGLKIIDVKHNVKITGISNEHQIDVYWEYEIAGIKHRVAIECKNYNSLVSIGKVRDFYGALDDIGNINGVMVTKMGFQKGAKKFASTYGINLKELRPPNEGDWDGKIKTIIIEMNMVVPHIKHRAVDVDRDWIKENIKLPEGTTVDFSIGGMADNIWIYDKEGNKLKNFHQLDQGVPHNHKTEIDLKHTYEFVDGYIETEKYGKIKIISIRYLYDVSVGKKQFNIDGQLTAKAILKDAISGNIQFFNKDGSVT